VGLPFPELKQREHINAAAKAANESPDFSALILVGRSDSELVSPGGALPTWTRPAVKALSPHRRFVIALHSPDRVTETGLQVSPPEKGR
jgi:hypothetical protein